MCRCYGFVGKSCSFLSIHSRGSFGTTCGTVVNVYSGLLPVQWTPVNCVGSTQNLILPPFVLLIVPSSEPLSQKYYLQALLTLKLWLQDYRAVDKQIPGRALSPVQPTRMR